MINCPICNSKTSFLAQRKDRFGQEYDYVKCESCRFLFEKGLVGNREPLTQKVGKVYGKEYFEKIDTGWRSRGDRALGVINFFVKIYSFLKKKVSVLDYGAGNAYVTSKIKTYGAVFYYDTYEKPTYPGNYTVLQTPQHADVVCAIELVEHLTDMAEWGFLDKLMPGMFIFTTCVTDNIGDQELETWEYFNPDAGHTALYSTRSLYLLAKKYGFVYFFFPNIQTHIFLKNRLLGRINVVGAEYAVYSFLRKGKNIFK